MAYVVPKGKVGQHEFTLTAGAVEMVTFSEDLDGVEIISDGLSAVYVTVDGSDPAVAGQSSWVLPAGIMGLTLDVPTSGVTVVKLVSAGTPKMSVTRPSRER